MHDVHLATRMSRAFLNRCKKPEEYREHSCTERIYEIMKRFRYFIKSLFPVVMVFILQIVAAIPTMLFFLFRASGDAKPALNELLASLSGLTSDMEYLQTKTGNIVDKIQEIDSRIDEVAAGWKTRRMGKVELTILRLALYEMDYDDTVPAKVAVNEAVELAKKFGGSDSPAFVNGVLAKFIRKEETTTETEPANEKTAQAQETEA